MFRGTYETALALIFTPQMGESAKQITIHREF